MHQSAPITQDTIFTRADDLLSNQVDNEVVMMHFERGQYYGLDPIGSDIWNRLAQPLRVGDLCDQLIAHYNADPETCTADVLDLLADMESEALIRRVSSTPE